MEHSLWYNLYEAWGWLLWVGMIVLLLSNLGHWGFSYGLHQKMHKTPEKDALSLLNERYARGEIDQETYNRMKSELDSHEEGMAI